MSDVVSESKPTASLKHNERKWTRPLMSAGFTVVPDVVIKYQARLGLDPVDLAILLHLASYWWTAENLPHPSKGRMAKALGVDASTVRRHIAKMEQAKLIQRKPRHGQDGEQQSNDYAFDGLIARATAHAEEEMAARRDRKQRDLDRQTKRQAKPVKAAAEVGHE